jgi:transposase
MAQRVISAGIDVSKDWFDVALWPTREGARFARDDAGMAALAAWLSDHAVMRIGVEVAAGSERMVIEQLTEVGFEICRFNALQVRRSAQATGRLAKNDTAWPASPV